MTMRRRRASLRSRLHLPARTVRFRLTLLYGSGFLIALAGLPAIGYLVYEHARTTFDISTHPAAAQAPPQSASSGAWFRGPTLHPGSGVAGVLLQLGIAVVLLAALAGLAYGLGWLVAGRVLRPLQIMRDTTRRISERNLHQRLAVQGPNDELKDLADTIDGLLARLDAAFDAQRRFIANAAHELRTPLTLQRALLEVALDDPKPTVTSLRLACERAVAAGERHERLIESLLTLATGERGLDTRETVDLAGLGRAVLQVREPEAARGGIRVVAALEPAWTQGSPPLVERLVANLVDNALRYNLPGGGVEVATSTTAGAALLAVSNDGPLVSADEVERMFQPFERLGDRRSGAPDGYGLGLSIARAIAAAHGAEITALPRIGGGLQVEVRFPALEVTPAAQSAASSRSRSASAV